MIRTPLMLYKQRVQVFFQRNAERIKPWKVCIYALGHDLDIAGTAYAEFVVPRGLIAGERVKHMPAINRALGWSVQMPLCFVGYVTRSNARDIDGRKTGKVCLAHFVDEGGNDYYVNKRFHEVFGRMATRYYLSLTRHYITYCTNADDTALGCVVLYMPEGGDSNDR